MSTDMLDLPLEALIEQVRPAPVCVRARAQASHTPALPPQSKARIAAGQKAAAPKAKKAQKREGKPAQKQSVSRRRPTSSCNSTSRELTSAFP